MSALAWNPSTRRSARPGENIFSSTLALVPTLSEFPQSREIPIPSFVPQIPVRLTVTNVLSHASTEAVANR